MSIGKQWLVAFGVVVAAIFIAAEQKKQMDMTTIIIYTPKK